MRFLSFLLIVILTCACMPSSAQETRNLPDGYTLLYEQDFEENARLSDFEMTDPAAWRIHEEDGNHSLELFGKSDYRARVRSPHNIAFLRAHRFGDFVLEVNLAQTGREYGHRDMCLFFGMKDASNFYYVHIASKADPHAHNIFLVNDEPRVAIAEKTTDGIDWGKVGQWQKVKIERSVSEGTIRVYFDNMKTPIMETTDTHFGDGYIGFGSFDDTGRVDNIKIYGPKTADSGYGFFNQ